MKDTAHPPHRLRTPSQSVQTRSRNVQTPCASLQTQCGNEANRHHPQHLFCTQTTSVITKNTKFAGQNTGGKT